MFAIWAVQKWERYFDTRFSTEYVGVGVSEKKSDLQFSSFEWDLSTSNLSVKLAASSALENGICMIRRILYTNE